MSFGSGYGMGYGQTQQPIYGPYPLLPSPQMTPAPPSGSPSPMPSFLPSTQPTGTPSAPAMVPLPGAGAERYDYRRNFFYNYGTHPFVEAAEDPLSTFAADVDSAAYSLARAYLNAGLLPPPEAVRTEEFINSFNYRYPQPLEDAFAIHTELGPAYFGDAQTRLLRIGLQGREIIERHRKKAVLTLLIDVSGSMNRDRRLELVKQSLGLLLDQLQPDDHVGIVTFGTEARIQLQHTPLSHRHLIQQVIDNLRPEGSTHTLDGLKLAYQEASRIFQPGHINRIVLCSDGVSTSGPAEPAEMLEQTRIYRQQGITLTTLGFGLQGFNDYLLEQLANQGNGHYAYIDSLNEARRLFVDQLTGLLEVIASDVKVQVAFDPSRVQEYRLLGYENRSLADEDFRNDAVDAGEVGANHSVTALYTVRFVPGAPEGELARVFLRYRDSRDQQFHERERAVLSTELQSFSNTSAGFQLATAVAAFAEVLRDSVFARETRLSDVARLGQNLQQQVPQDDSLREWLQMMSQASQLKQPSASADLEQLVTQSQNPEQLNEWQAYLRRQLGGRSQR